MYVPRTPTNRYLSADADAALLTMQSNKTTVGAMVTGMLVSGALQYTSTVSYTHLTLPTSDLV